MAGLLDFLNSDDARLGIGLLSAAGPTTDPNQTGFGQRLNTAMAGIDARKQAEIDRQYKQAQISDVASQAQQRAQQVALARYQMQLDAYMTGASTTPPTIPTFDNSAPTNLGMGTAPPTAAMGQGAAPQTTPPTAGGAPAGTPTGIPTAAGGGAGPSAPSDGAGTRDSQGMPIAPVGGAFKPLPQIAQDTGIPLTALVVDWQKNGGKNIGDWVMKASGPLKGSMQMVGNIPNIVGVDASGNKTLTPMGGAASSYGMQKGIEEGIAAQNRGKEVTLPDGSKVTVSEADAINEGRAKAGLPPLNATPTSTAVASVTGTASGAPSGAPFTGSVKAAPGVDQSYTSATEWTESNGDPNAVSLKGAKSRMQVMDATAANPGHGIKPADPNIPGDRERVGAQLQSALLGKYNGDKSVTALAYNWGEGNVDKLLSGKLSNADFAKMPIEAKDYLAKVAMRDYKLRQGQDGSAAPTAPNAPPTSAAPATAPPAAGSRFVNQLDPVSQAKIEANAKVQGSMGDLVKDKISQSQTRADAAQNAIERMDSITENLKNKPYLGALADKRVVWANLVQTFGGDDKDMGKRVAATQAVQRDMAQTELNYAQQYMKGQGQVSDSERGIVRRASTGQIQDFTGPELRLYVGAMRKIAQHQVDQHNQLIDGVQNGMSPTDLLKVGQGYASRTPTPQQSATGTSVPTTPTGTPATASQQIASQGKKSYAGYDTPAEAIRMAQAAIKANPTSRAYVEGELRKSGLSLPGSAISATTATGSW